MSHTSNNSDISIKEAILRFQDYAMTVLRRWKFIAICGFLLAFILGALKFNTAKAFKADLSFMVDEDSQGALSGLTGILGSIGLGGSQDSNLDKILDLSKTRTITERVLFDSLTIDGKSDFIANLIITSLENQKKWEEKPLIPIGIDKSLDLKDFRFTHSRLLDFSVLENKALKKLHYFFVGKDGEGRALSTDFSELSGILQFSMTTDNQDLSISVINRFFDKLSTYYVEKKAEKQNKDFSIIESKYDSITNKLSQTQYAIAKFGDNYRGLISRTDKVKEKQLKTEEQKLLLMLGEMEKQYQLAQITLQNKSAFIQVIDRPIPPLKPINKGALYYFLLGGFLGGVLSVGYIVIKKGYQEIMA